jgi:hypothetical protein
MEKYCFWNEEAVLKIDKKEEIFLHPPEGLIDAFIAHQNEKLAPALT